MYPCILSYPRKIKSSLTYAMAAHIISFHVHMTLRPRRIRIVSLCIYFFLIPNFSELYAKQPRSKTLKFKRGQCPSSLRTGSPLSHVRERRRAKRCSGKESGEGFHFLVLRLRRSISRSRLRRADLILRRPRSFAASSPRLSSSSVWCTLCEVVFMTSGPFVNFHQSERMYFIPRSVECMECNSKWKVSSRLCKTLATCFGVEKLFSERFKTLKKLVSS